MLTCTIIGQDTAKLYVLYVCQEKMNINKEQKKIRIIPVVLFINVVNLRKHLLLHFKGIVVSVAIEITFQICRKTRKNFR